ncbi:C-type natriuretic peptide 2 [Engraulis encrasicolus]|uniref:C-type natriuretic peptide 2 n=1 Tax=Engraulis encrasicolus TaxID=184585 RepID=UPI002FD4BFD3
MASSCTSRLPSCCLSFLVLILVLATVQVESRPTQQRSDDQILRDLFGQEISSLLLASERRSEVTEPEGSASGPPALLSSSSRATSESVAPPPPSARHSPVPPQRVLKLLGHQRKFNNRNRKSTGRGCFGLKVDRISIMSGLGC